MKIAIFAVTALALLALAGPGAPERYVSGKSKAEAPTGTVSFLPADAEFIGLSPSQQKFLMQPGQLLVVLAAGQCKASDRFGGSIDVLRPPTPDFVQLVPLCRANDSVIGALILQPANKDVGSFTVRVDTHGCDGTPQEYSFQVKVKKGS